MRKPTEKHSLGNGISVDSIDLTDITLEKQYETTFGQFNSPDRPDGSINESKRGKNKDKNFVTENFLLL